LLRTMGKGVSPSVIMEFKDNIRLGITENLLMLERGREELLLANGVNPRPLYIKKGRRYVSDFLKAASELGTYKKIVGAFPNEGNLLDALMDHEIIFPAGPQKDSAPPVNLPLRLDLDNKRNVSLYLLLSQSCNMGCVYCLNGTKTYQKDKNFMMSKEVAFTSIERCLDSIVSGGCLEIIFFGGEPLLNWPLAKEVIIHCEKVLKANYPEKRIRYHFTSNLSFLPADLIAWATRYNVTFLCDIDGPGPIHDACRPFKSGSGSHEIIVRNVKRLIGAGLRVNLRATITSLNQDHLLEIAEHHKEIGGNSCAFVPVIPVNSDEDILAGRLLPSPRKIINGLKAVYKSKIWKSEELHPFNQYASRFMPGARMPLGCGAPYGNTPVVDVNGDVYACIYLVGVREFYLGNIMNGSYPDKGVLGWMYDYLHVDNFEDCRSCPWRYLCGGGCPVGRLTVLRNPAVSKRVAAYFEQIRCECTRELMELVLWDMARESASSLLKEHNAGETIEHTIHC
jgi:uncharacterized protein